MLALLIAFCHLPPLTVCCLLHHSNGGTESVIAGYRLKFLMPEEEEDQLRKFTLSREVVFNVFRQFLYDQEADLAQPLFIAPDSLQTF